MYKRRISILLALIMILSSLAGGFEVKATEVATPMLSEETINLIKDFDLKDRKTEYSEEYEKQNEETVRVLVEVDENSILDIMSTRGVEYADLSMGTVKSIEDKVDTANEAAISTLCNEFEDVEIISEYNVAFSGFAAEVKKSDIEKIKEINGVKNVYISQRYILEKPTMITSHELIKDNKLWENLKYKGEGMIVAVIDSGTDVAHDAMKLSETTTPTLTSANVAAKISENNLPGKYYTSKVPYGYNYFDGNYEIKDKGPSASEHGMHVAGTVAANGDVLKGVAPEAQILGMKVFGNDPLWGTTYDDIYLKAISDAIVLGADVLNMSLGSPAGFDNLQSTMDKTLTKAVESGIVCAIAAGNESHIYYGFNNQYPFDTDPDYGVVGSPSVYEDSISVASINNNSITLKLMDYYANTAPVEEVLPIGAYIFGDKAATAEVLGESEELLKACQSELFKNNVFLKQSDAYIATMTGAQASVGQYPAKVNFYTSATESTLVSVLKAEGTEPQESIAHAGYMLNQGDFVALGEVEYVIGGVGRPEQIPDEVKDKVAVIERGGDLTFTEKVKNAMAKGAIGVVIYNHTSGGDEVPGMVVEPVSVPVAAIGHSDGVKLSEAVTKKLKFTEEINQFAHPKSGAMSDFSSMGPTPQLRMKPELTAPGGSIYSTLNDNRYGNMSGTSMATPHVAGGSALIQQYLKKEFPNMGIEERTRLVKTLLMNTATIVEDARVEAPYSVRKQGAGLMNLAAATETPAYVTAKDGRPKFELKSLDKNEFELEFTLKSLKDAAEYDVKAITISEIAMQGYYAMAEQLIENSISGDVHVSVEKGRSTSGKVKVSIPTLPINNYIEGWLVFTSKDDSIAQLVVPFIGFYGDWDELRIFDDIPVTENSKSKYEIATPVHLSVDPKTNKTNFAGPSDEVAFSPGTFGGKTFGKYNVIPVFTLFRNVEGLKAVIKDEKGNVLTTLISDLALRKNYYNGGRGRKFYLSDEFLWDGTAYGENAPLEDGIYTYELQARSVGGKKVQTASFKTMIDTKDPSVTDLEIDVKNKTATFTAVDNEGGSGIDICMIDLVKLIGEIPEKDTQASTGVLSFSDEKVVSLGNNRYQVDISKLFDEKYRPTDNYKFNLLVLDDARNFTVRSKDLKGEFNGQSDEVLIYLPKPDLQIASNINRIQFEGFITTDKKITAEVEVAGKVIATFNRLQQDGSIEIRDEEGNLVAVKPGYRFSEYVNLAPGYSMTKLVVKDATTKEVLSSVQRAVLVDTIPPVIKNVELKQIEGTNNVNVKMTVVEQEEYFKILADKSHVFTFDEMKDFTKPTAIEKSVEFVVENVRPTAKSIKFEVIDAAENKQTHIADFQIVNTIPVDKDELKALYDEFMALNSSEYNAFSKEYIEMAKEVKSVIESADATKEIVDKNIKSLKMLKAALVKIEDEKATTVNLQETSTIGTFGKPSIKLDPVLTGPVAPTAYCVGEDFENAKNIGESMLIPYEANKRVTITFLSADGLTMFDRIFDLSVAPITVPDILSITYIQGKVKVGSKMSVYAQVYNSGKPVVGAELTLDIYDSANNKVLDAQLATTNDRGIATFSYNIADNALLGTYRAEVKRVGDATLSANQTFTVIAK